MSSFLYHELHVFDDIAIHTLRMSPLPQHCPPLFDFVASINWSVRWSNKNPEFRLHRSFCGSNWLPPTWCFRRLHLGFRSFWSLGVSQRLHRITVLSPGRRLLQSCHWRRISLELGHFTVAAGRRFHPTASQNTSTYARLHASFNSFTHDWVQFVWISLLTSQHVRQKRPQLLYQVAFAVSSIFGECRLFSYTIFTKFFDTWYQTFNVRLTVFVLSHTRSACFRLFCLSQEFPRSNRFDHTAAFCCGLQSRLPMLRRRHDSSLILSLA